MGRRQQGQATTREKHRARETRSQGGRGWLRGQAAPLASSAPARSRAGRRGTLGVVDPDPHAGGGQAADDHQQGRPDHVDPVVRSGLHGPSMTRSPGARWRTRHPPEPRPPCALPRHRRGWCPGPRSSGTVGPPMSERALGDSNTKVLREVKMGRPRSELPLNSARRPTRSYRLLNLREAEVEFGLYELQVYAAVSRGEIHPVQLPGGKRLYYCEWELRQLVEVMPTDSRCYPRHVA